MGFYCGLNLRRRVVNAIDDGLSARSAATPPAEPQPPHGNRKTTIFTASLRLDGMSAPMRLDGAMHGAAFLPNVEHVIGARTELWRYHHRQSTGS